MTWTDVSDFWHRLIVQEEERRARAVLLEWLPRPFRWLVDHPRLLGLYLKLPHRTHIMARCEYPYSTATYSIEPRQRTKAKESHAD